MDQSTLYIVTLHYSRSLHSLLSRESYTTRAHGVGLLERRRVVHELVKVGEQVQLSVTVRVVDS